jgi:hypothetical protein
MMVYWMIAFSLEVPKPSPSPEAATLRKREPEVEGTKAQNRVERPKAHHSKYRYKGEQIEVDTD